jgi:hypothetical protein
MVPWNPEALQDVYRRPSGVLRVCTDWAAGERERSPANLQDDRKRAKASAGVPAL